MIFSLFKKKSQDDRVPAAKVVRVPAAQEVTPSGAPVSAPAVAEEGVGAPVTDSHGFSSADFTDLSLGDLDNGGILLEDEGDPLQSVVEQAAVLYANGQDSVARSTLEDAVARYRSGTTAERLWLMLLDLYQMAGEKESFESLSLEFAKVFEKSSPSWHNACAVPGPAPDRVPAAVFRGDMVGNNHAAFGILADSLEKSARLRLDLSKVQSLDNEGAARFLDLLLQSAKRKQPLALLGLAQLEHLLSAKVVPGQRQDPDCWLLQLELLQRQGQQEAFEEKAVDYAVTFEVSPPSWDGHRVQPQDQSQAPEKSPEEAEGGHVQGDVYRCVGEIRNERFPDLKDFAATRDPVVVDFAAVVRIDFVSAGALVNVLTPAKQAGKAVFVRGANRLVAELLALVGVTGVARILPLRK